jgi:hypothetical protein
VVCSTMMGDTSDDCEAASEWSIKGGSFAAVKTVH